MTEILFARLDEITPSTPVLTALSLLDASTGLLTQTGASTFLKRSLAAGALLGVTNGDGVAGNPTIAVTDAELVAIAGLTSAADRLPYFTGLGTASLATFTAFARTIVDDVDQPTMQATLGLVPGTNVQAFDSDLAALAANVTAGLWASTAVGSGAARSLTAPAAGITITNPAGTAGNPTFVLANDLAALEALSTTGLARRTGTDTWSVGSQVSLATEVTGNLPVTNLNSGTTASSSTFWRGDGVWATPAGGGTVTSVVADGLTITNTGTVPFRYGYANALIGTSAAGGALTISLLDNTGAAPSATSPANFVFRNLSGTNSTWAQLAATSALSLVVPSGGTLGVTSATAFRLWVVMFNDAGTLRLGVFNASTASATAAQIFPLNESVPISSTAIGAASNSAGVFYTGVAVTSKAFIILGYIEWNNAGLTAGTWTTTNLFNVQSMGPGIKKPGDIVQTAMATTTTGASTAALAYTTGLTQAITPTSSANLIEIAASGRIGLSTLTNPAFVTLFRSATQLQSELFANINTATVVAGSSLGPYLDKPNTTSSTSYSIQLESDGTHTVTWAASGDAGAFGVMTVKELMG